MSCPHGRVDPGGCAECTFTVLGRARDLAHAEGESKLKRHHVSQAEREAGVTLGCGVKKKAGAR